MGSIWGHFKDTFKSTCNISYERFRLGSLYTYSNSVQRHVEDSLKTHYKHFKYNVGSLWGHLEILKDSLNTLKDVMTVAMLAQVPRALHASLPLCPQQNGSPAAPTKTRGHDYVIVANSY